MARSSASASSCSTKDLPHEEVDQVRARVTAAGLPVDEHAEGFAVRDPAGIAVLITTSN
jgi:hypothetical protein